MDIDMERLATLANFSLTPEEIARFQEQIPSILEYVSRLNDVDTSGVAVSALTPNVNVLREDEATSTVDERDAVVAGFPEVMGDALRVPHVFGE